MKKHRPFWNIYLLALLIFFTLVFVVPGIAVEIEPIVEIPEPIPVIDAKVKVLTPNLLHGGRQLSGSGQVV